MKILFVNVFYKPFIGGGVEITLENLVKGIKKLGNEVKILTLTNEKKIVYENIDDIEVIRIPIKNLYFPNFKIIKRPSDFKIKMWLLFDIYNPLNNKIIENVIREYSPDVVSLHNLQGFSIALWDVLKKLNYPFVQVLHDQYFLCPANFVRGGNICKKQCFQCKVLRYPHKIKSKNINVVGISNFILNKFLSYGYFSDASVKKVIYNSRIFGNEIYLNARRKKENKIIYGYIGTLIKYKGIENLLKIFKYDSFFKKRQLLVAGSGEKNYMNYLKNKYKSDNIIFLGRVSQKYFFPNVDVTVVPSIVEEGLGMSAIESLMFGKPVIVSNRGALPEIVSDNKVGYVFDIYDNNDLTKKLMTFEKNISYFKEQENYIRNYALQNFGYENWIRKWVTTYKELARLK